MKKISRRSALAGLASMPLLSSKLDFASKNAAILPSSRTRWLNVYIHGACVLDIYPAGMRLFFPKVLNSNGLPAHEYRAGYLPNSEGGTVNERDTLWLSGFQGPGSMPALDPTTFPYVNKPTLNLAPVFYTVMVPPPDAFVPLRQVPQICGKDPFFLNGDFPNLSYIPLLLMLQYEIEPNEKPVLLGSSWHDDGRDPAIIHLRGEPGSETPDDALSQINAILGTNLKPNDNDYHDAVACPNGNEERCLAEIRNPSAPSCVPYPSSISPPCPYKGKEPAEVRKRSSHPANCVSIGNCPTC